MEMGTKWDAGSRPCPSSSPVGGAPKCPTAGEKDIGEEEGEEARVYLGWALEVAGKGLFVMHTAALPSPPPTLGAAGAGVREQRERGEAALCACRLVLPPPAHISAAEALLSSDRLSSLGRCVKGWHVLAVLAPVLNEDRTGAPVR